MNKHIKDNVSELLKTAIRFADTKRDADLIKGLFAKTTSVKHVAKMLNVQNRSSIRSAESIRSAKSPPGSGGDFQSWYKRNVGWTGKPSTSYD